MLNYETLLSFVYFQIILGEQNCSFCRGSTLNNCIRILYSATYLDKSKG